MRRKLSIPILLLACSCTTGPWNTQPGGGGQSLPRLTLSNLVVAGRDYDTLWLTRSLLLNGSAYDSTRMFVDTANSSIRVIRTSGPGAPDTIAYHLAAPLAVAWLPGKAADTAIHGAQYRLEAHIRWDTASNWGAGEVTPAWKVTDLKATTYTPNVFAQGPVLQAPLEALFPTLASSGFAAFQAWATNTSKSVQDSLAFRTVLPSTMDSLKRGLPVFRPITSGDAIWYIRSQESVAGLDGSSIQRNDRAFLAPQTLDRPVFGGILAFQRFDSTRARILDPITQTLYATLGKKSFTSTDSARYYQKGQWRSIDFTDAYVGSLPYWPDNAQIKNLDIGYTGLNVFYAYAMDTMYAAHLRGLSNASNALGYSNISGGTGYFSGAAADSVSIYVQSPTSDTFAVADLRHAYCYNRAMRLVDSLQKAHVTATATAYAVWLAQRPGQCSDFRLPQH